MLRSALLTCLIFLPGIANAICQSIPLEKEFHDAPNVFIATITGSALADGVKPQDLKARDRYQIRYSFVVAELFKGDASAIQSLHSQAVFDDPRDTQILHKPESTKFAPGDSVIVFAGDEASAVIGFCTILDRHPSKHVKALRRLSLQLTPSSGKKK